MWRSKKIIGIMVLVAVMLVGGISGVVFATDNVGDDQPGTKCGALLDRVCEIYQEDTGVAIDLEELKDAFAEARREMREAALQDHLQNLVGEGKINQGEADQYLEWWRSKPDVPVGFNFHGLGRMRGFGRLCIPVQ